MTDAVAATTRRREATRQKLLDAAAQVFAEVGLDAASVEAICERAGFTRGAFYSNFETKDELFLELAGNVARERVAGGAQPRARARGRAARSTRCPTIALDIVQRVLDVSADDRLGVLLMSEIRIHALRNPQLAAAYLAQEDEMRRSVAQIIERHRSRQVAALPPPGGRGGAPHAHGLGGRVGARRHGRPRLRARCAARTNEELARVAQLIIDAAVSRASDRAASRQQRVAARRCAPATTPAGRRMPRARRASAGSGVTRPTVQHAAARRERRVRRRPP